jgi:hypothetical protein
MQEQKDKSEETPAEKTPEQLAQERLERYQKNPDSFVEISELVVATIKTPKGMSIYISNHCLKSDIALSMMELNHGISKMLLRREVESDMKRQAAQGLIKPARGIIDFARRKGN